MKYQETEKFKLLGNHLAAGWVAWICCVYLTLLHDADDLYPHKLQKNRSAPMACVVFALGVEKSICATSNKPIERAKMCCI